MSNPDLALRWLDGSFAIHRLSADAAIPAACSQAVSITISRTSEELSIVAPASLEIVSPKVDAGWAMFVFDGVLDFSLTGILAGVAQPLANAGISIFATSTFDTDYVMVKQDQVNAVTEVLMGAGYSFANAWLDTPERG